MTRDEFIMNRVREHYDEATSLGYEVVALFLQGSQNYNLDVYDDEYQSDIDTKCIILPTLDDIVFGRTPCSITYVRANNEHIDFKDIRVMFDMFKRQNNSYIELLFTKYLIINPKYEKLVMELLSLKNELCRANVNAALRTLAGTSANKLVALEHPYPTIVAKIEKYGYDPKQLHHILRLNDFMHKYIDGKPYEECLIPDNIEYLIEIKKGKLSLLEARSLATSVNAANQKLKNDNCTKEDVVNYEVITKLDELKFALIKQFLKEELLNE